jgi:hypothetical protein
VNDVVLSAQRSVSGTSSDSVFARERHVANSGSQISTWAILGLSADALTANPFVLGTVNATSAQVAAIRSAISKQDFFEGVSAYQTDGWDGDNAVAISGADVKRARSLLDLIAGFEPKAPDIAPGQDGSICLEWKRYTSDGEKKIYVDVGPNGRILTYAKLGSFSPIEKHFPSDTAGVIDHLSVMFSIYSIG